MVNWGALGNDLRELATARKHFDGGLVGHAGLNRFGLHPARILTTDALLSGRRLTLAPRHRNRAFDHDLDGFFRDGVAAIHPFFPKDVFTALREEVRAHVAAAAEASPLPRNSRERGFGKKRPFPGGFDRFDGSTLNRFLDIDAQRLPLTDRALRDDRLRAACERASGFLHAPERFSIYQTVQGDPDNHDIQQDAHRDTFHSTVKLWLFLEPVHESDGPFAYIPGSHRMTARRLRWEYARANAACAPKGPRGGAFRVSEAEREALGLPPAQTYPVPENTLVLADVRGIHHRSLAEPGATRLALYASLRKWPFAPLPR